MELLDGFAGPGGGGRVLDVGCGDKPYEPLIRAKGYDYVAADLNGSPDITIRPGEPIGAPDRSFAGIVSFQVLEHVWDIDWYLGECRRLLQPGGWLLLSTHGVWPYHPHPTDFRRWTRQGLCAELEMRGFHVIAVRGLLGPLAWTTQVRALGLRHVLLQSRVLRTLVPFVMAAMNLRMRLEDLVTPEAIRIDNACIYTVFCRLLESPDAHGSAR